MALHEQSVGATNEWYTPAHVFSALGVNFDADVAAPRDLTFITTPALEFIHANSLATEWVGFVWMNPPFGGRNGLVPWLAKFFAHGNGVALVPDRTSAPWWQEFAPKADALLFVSRKLKFLDVMGQPGNSPAQGTTLMAAGPKGVAALKEAERAGLGLVFERPVGLSDGAGHGTASTTGDGQAPGIIQQNPPTGRDGEQ